MAILTEAWGRRNAEQVKAAFAPPPEAPKERISAEAAAAIMAEAGIRNPQAIKTVAGIEAAE